MLVIEQLIECLQERSSFDVLQDKLLITLALSLYDSSSDMSKSRPFPANVSEKYNLIKLIKVSIKNVGIVCLINLSIK